MMHFNFAKVLAPLLAVPALLCGTAFSQRTIHVPADAPTIQDGIDLAGSGDTVLVSPGTYNENIDFKGKAITVTSGAKSFTDTAAASTIINGSADGPVVTFQSNEPASAVLNGFTVQNGHSSVPSPLNGGGVFISNSSPTVTNNIVTSNVGCGVAIFNLASPVIQGNDIKLTAVPPGIVDGSACNNQPGMASTAGAEPGTGLAIVGAGNVQIIGNTIENNGFNFGTNNVNPCPVGVDVDSTVGALFANNIIRNNAACTPELAANLLSPAGKLVLIQNLIYGNLAPDEPSQVVIWGTYQPPYPSLIEINNTIYGGGEELVLGFGSSTVSNNVFISSAKAIDVPVDDSFVFSGLWCGDPQYHPYPQTITHNDIFNTGTLQSGGCPLGDGNLSVDPQFLNPAATDFHTQPTSPIVAAGDINAPMIPAADLDNKARTVCNSIDMGAYEVRPHPPLALMSSENPAPGASSLTFTVHLTGNCNVPTGTVTFLDGSTAIGTGILDNSGVAEFTTSFLVVGEHNITAQYAGDFNFDSSTSAVLVQTITGDPTSTSIEVAPNPAIAFSPITLSGVVTSHYGLPTGSVIFTAGGALLATAPLDANGRAVASISTLGAGAYSILASYTADTRFQPSSSAPSQEIVAGANTATTLNATPNPAVFGQTVTLTATVSIIQSAAPFSGTAVFRDATAELGTATVNTNGIASLTISSLSAGTHTLTASYEGSTNLGPSTSATVNETISAPALDFTLSTKGSASQTIAAGKVATYTFVILPTNVDYPGAVSFGVSGLPEGANYTISPSALAADAGMRSLTMTVTTPESSTAVKKRGDLYPWSPSSRVSWALAFLLLPYLRARRFDRSRMRGFIFMALLLGACTALLGTEGCGVTPGPSPGKMYSVTLTATSASTQHSAAVTLISRQ